ncbi:MAG TPA: amidohydrolase family protein [Chitinophagaceae bacterium]|nr:amidohydrolase family protein [Chitinophagaceae bacterium]
MKFRKFTADYLFTGCQMVKDAVLITDDQGVIDNIVPFNEAGGDVETLHGILTPGLINCHCHLELSHLQDVIPPHTGLIEFLVSVVQKRDFNREIIQEAIARSEQEMYNNGIVAVGDICNTTDAVTVKSNSRIYWNSFIEVLSFTDEHAVDRMTHYSNVLGTHRKQLPGYFRNELTPHAPYTISPRTFELINQATKDSIISIHNQEHPAEDVLYKTGAGDYLRLFRIFGIHRSPFPVTGKSSIQSYLPYFNNRQRIFLIHNTYMSEEDIVFANAYAAENGLGLMYCLCVNANRYIENTVPPVEMFVRNNCHIVLGTDSYSSNWQLNMAKEIEAVLSSSYFRYIPYMEALEIALKWTTINGAVALQIDDTFGSFEKGKKPGIVLLENIEERKISSKRIL